MLVRAPSLFFLLSCALFPFVSSGQHRIRQEDLTCAFVAFFFVFLNFVGLITTRCLFLCIHSPTHLVKLNSIILQEAVVAGYVNFLQWATELFPRHLKFVLDLAKTNFHVPVLEWQKGELDISYFLEGVMHGGHYFTGLLKKAGLEGLRYLWKYHPSKFSGPIAAHAVLIGDVAFAREWLDPSNPPEDYTLALMTALSKSKFEMTKLLWEFGVRIPKGYPQRRAIENVGDLEFLKWISSVTSYDNTEYQDVMRNACSIGSKDMITWLLDEKGLEWPPDAMLHLLRGRSTELFEFLKWTRERGCPWDNEATVAVVDESLPLEMLKWMIEEGCPHDDEQLMALAVEMPKNSEILKWLHEVQDIPFPDDLFDSLWPTCADNLEYLLQATNRQLTNEELWDLANFEPSVMIPFLMRKYGRALDIEMLFIISQSGDLEALNAIYFGEDPRPHQIWDADVVSLLLWTESWDMFDWGVKHGLIVDDEAKRFRKEEKPEAERQAHILERNPEFRTAVGVLERNSASWQENSHLF